MFYTYILRSISHPDQRYIGSTDDLKARLAKHNAGEVSQEYTITTIKNSEGVAKLLCVLQHP